MCLGPPASASQSVLLATGRRVCPLPEVVLSQAGTFRGLAICRLRNLLCCENLKGDHCSLCDDFNVSV